MGFRCAIVTSLGLSERQLITSFLGEQGYKQHRSVDTLDACIPMFVAPTTTTAVAALAYFDLEPVPF